MHVYGEIEGTLTSSGKLSGLMSTAQGISGTLTAQSNLSGTLTGSGHLSGFLGATRSLSGTLTIPSAVGVEPYTGAYEVTPKAWDAQTLETAHKLMSNNVTVFKVPYYEISNLFDGKTAYIAEETNGN